MVFIAVNDMGGSKWERQMELSIDENKETQMERIHHKYPFPVRALH